MKSLQSLARPARLVLLVAGVCASAAGPAAAQRYEPDPDRWERSGPADTDRARIVDPDEDDDRSPARSYDRAERYDPAANDDRATGETSFAELDRYGRWVEHAEWGTVWRPRVDEGWRPYTVGRWIATEEHGWYWESDEPFGWATFHYGRWVFDEDRGWLWIPGTEWGPAWVAWSEGDDMVGWAPLPPDAVWDEDRGVYLADNFYGPRFAPWWVFVAPRYLLAHGVQRHVSHHRHNSEVMRRVRPATHYRFDGRRIYNTGIAFRSIERMTGARVTPLRVMVGPGPQMRGARGGDRVNVFRPLIVPNDRWRAGAQGDWRRFDAPRRQQVSRTPGSRVQEPRGQEWGRERGFNPDRRDPRTGRPMEDQRARIAPPPSSQPQLQPRDDGRPRGRLGDEPRRGDRTEFARGRSDPAIDPRGRSTPQASPQLAPQTAAPPSVQRTPPATDTAPDPRRMWNGGERRARSEPPVEPRGQPRAESRPERSERRLPAAEVAPQRQVQREQPRPPHASPEAQRERPPQGQARGNRQPPPPEGEGQQRGGRRGDN